MKRPIKDPANTTSSPEDPTPEPASPPPQNPRTGTTRYDPEFALLICQRIATTTQSVLKICEAPDMPGVASVFRWLNEYPDFRDMYLLAKQLQAELFIEETLDLVDDTSQDVIVTADGKTILNRVAIQRCKLRVENRRWLASKLLPRKYGPRPQQEQPQGHQEQPQPRQQPQSSTRTPPPPPTPEQANNGGDDEVTMPEAFRLKLCHLRRLMNGTPEEVREAERFHAEWTAEIAAGREPGAKYLTPEN